MRRAQSGQAERVIRELIGSLLGTGLTPTQISVLFNDALSKVKP